MNLVIVHYHLNRGGVASVIRNHLRALDASEGPVPNHVLILHGPGQEGWTPPDPAGGAAPASIEIPSLAYDSPGNAADARTLTAELHATLAEHSLTPDDTIVHVHNHCLGKNAALPSALRNLADGGYRLLLQIHDFAEDYRPANYRHLLDSLGADGPESLADYLYPLAQHIHFAVLNGRDRSTLGRAGVPEERLHLLPNPVPIPGELRQRDSCRRRLHDHLGIDRTRPLILYAVRAIRRKNLGELLLWSAIHPDVQFAVTLAPRNPIEKPAYRFWKEGARHNQLSVFFELGERSPLSLIENLSAADAMISTSVAEGFGLALLESWTIERPLFGRNLPEITADFHQEGIQFPWLYGTLPIPIRWIERWADFRTHWIDQTQQIHGAYGLTDWTQQQAIDAFDQMTKNGQIDFAQLDRERQHDVIKQTASDPGLRGELIAICQQLQLDGPLDGPETLQIVAANRDRVLERYNLRVCGERLRSIFDRLLASSPSTIDGAASSRAVLDEFLNPKHMHLIRLEP